MLITLAASIPSMAIMAPRTSSLGELSPGEGRGDEICDKTRILFSTGIDMIIASTPELCDVETEAGLAENGDTIVSMGGNATLVRARCC